MYTPPPDSQGSCLVYLLADYLLLITLLCYGMNLQWPQQARVLNAYSLADIGILGRCELLGGRA